MLGFSLSDACLPSSDGAAEEEEEAASGASVTGWPTKRTSPSDTSRQRSRWLGLGRRASASTSLSMPYTVSALSAAGCSAGSTWMSLLPRLPLATSTSPCGPGPRQARVSWGAALPDEARRMVGVSMRTPSWPTAAAAVLIAHPTTRPRSPQHAEARANWRIVR